MRCLSFLAARPVRDNRNVCLMGKHGNVKTLCLTRSFPPSLLSVFAHTSGLVFNPATPLDHAKYVMDKIDIILLMSVNPGFGGQSFIPSTLDKLREARKMIDESGYDIRLEVNAQ